MAESYKRLYQGQLPAVVGALYTVPAATQVIIKHVRVINTSGATRSATLYQGAATDANLLLPTLDLDAGEWADFDGTLFADAADVFRGVSDGAAAITVSIHGIEVTA